MYTQHWCLKFCAFFMLEQFSTSLLSNLANQRETLKWSGTRTRQQHFKIRHNKKSLTPWNPNMKKCEVTQEFCTVRYEVKMNTSVVLFSPNRRAMFDRPEDPDYRPLLEEQQQGGDLQPNGEQHNWEPRELWKVRHRPPQDCKAVSTEYLALFSVL